MGIHDQLSNQCLAYKADYTLLVYACLHNWIPIPKKKKKKKAGTGVWRISLPGCMGLYFIFLTFVYNNTESSLLIPLLGLDTVSRFAELFFWGAKASYHYTCILR